MTGEELGIKLLKMLAAVQSGKATKGVSTAEITRKSNELTKPEYDDFYYMTQIGNLITNLSKQAKSYNYAFFRWFLGIELSLEEIIRAEKTLERNKNMDATDLLTFKNFYNVPENIEGINCNYALCHQAVRGLMAVNSLIAILMKAYHLPFMKCYMFDMTELQEKLAYFNNLVDKLEKYTASQNTINCFRKIDLNEWRLDPEMLKLTEKVAILSHLDSLILTWCSNYEVILNNLMEFELFDNPDWQLAYMRPDGTKYGNFKYPERDGKNKWGINVKEKY